MVVFATRTEECSFLLNTDITMSNSAVTKLSNPHPVLAIKLLKKIKVKLRMEMGNVSKRQQPDHGTAEGH